MGVTTELNLKRTAFMRLLFGSSTDMASPERRFSLGALRRRFSAVLRLSEGPYGSAGREQ